MATFEIQGADGKTYQVEAPDMQSAAAAVSGFAQPRGGSSVNREVLPDGHGSALAFGTGAANGASFGFADNIAGAIGGIDSMVRGNGFRRGYDATLDIVRDGMAEAQQKHPMAYGTGEVGGAVAPALLAAPIATGRTALGTAGRAAGIGMAEGAAHGAGNADGQDMAAEAARGGAIGGLTGLAAPAAVAGTRAVGRHLSAPVAGALGVGNTNRARGVVNRAFNRSGKSLDDLNREAAEATAAGQREFVLADMLGSPGQGAASGVARSPGAGSRELREFLEARQLDAGDRTSEFVADALGSTDTAAQRQAALTAERKATADVNYSAAREGARPVDVRGALGVIDSRLGETADAAGTGFQGDGIDATFRQFRNRLAADRVPSDIDAMELSDFNRTLGVKQDMQDAAEAASRAGRNNEAREINRVVAELDKALEGASDGYRRANDTFRAQSQAIEAVEGGQVAARPGVRADDAIDQFRGMTPDAQDAFRSGLGNQLIGKIESQAPGANVALPMMRTRMDRLLQEVADDPSKLRSQIARENTMAETRQRAVGGSRTADNLADQEDVQAVDVGVIANLLSGNFGSAGAQLGQKAANAATGRNEATNQAIARMLMSNDPAAVIRPILEQQGRSATTNRMVEALLRNAIARPAT